MNISTNSENLSDMFGDVGGSCVDEDKPHVVINENWTEYMFDVDWECTFLFLDLEELHSLSLQSPGMGISWMSLISASCVGVLVLTSSDLSLRTSGLSVLVRTIVGAFNDLGNVSYKLPLSSWRERVWRLWIPLLAKYLLFGKQLINVEANY